MSEDKPPLNVYTIQGKLGDDGIIDTLVKQMRKDGISEEMIKHCLKTQVLPQLFEQGIGNKEIGHTRMVNPKLDTPGHLVACHKCGREARMATAPPEGMVATCPNCLMKLMEGGE